MEPLAFRDYIGVALCYLIFLMPIHLMIGGMGTLGSIILLFMRRAWFKNALMASWLFTALLLGSGFMLNLIWNIAVFDNLYWAYDYAGWECSPFGLTLCGIVEAPVRYSHGMSEGSIRGLWFIYAALSWGSAIWATCRIMKSTRVKRFLKPKESKNDPTLGGGTPSQGVAAPEPRGPDSNARREK